MEQHPSDTPSPRHEHEASDVNVRMIAISGAVAIAFGVFIHFMLGALMNNYSDQQSTPVGNERPLSDILWQTAQPRLQVDPAGELARLRTREDVALNTCGWVDRKSGVVRIPIDRAIDLTLKQGLPARSSSSPAAAPQQGDRSSR